LLDSLLQEKRMKSSLLLQFLVTTLMLLLDPLSADELQVVEDAEFVKLIKEEKYVVALFCSDGNEERCEEFEGELASIREDLIDITDGDGWVVKLVNSALIHYYSFTPDVPAIVMFRSGLPVLYDGPANEEVMLDTLSQNKEAGVQELTDSSFEHLTQAATGATTGDWFVLFYTDECELCHRMTAGLETLGCKLRGRSNVARVNKQTYGEKTGRRFALGLDNNPNIIYFRLGKMYRYQLEKYDPESMTNFINGFYKNYPAESIPMPKSPFDDLVQLCVDYLKEYPLLVGGCLMVPIIMILGFWLLMRTEEDRPRRSKKSKKDKSEKDGGSKEKKKDKTDKDSIKEKKEKVEKDSSSKEKKKEKTDKESSKNK